MAFEVGWENVHSKQILPFVLVFFALGFSERNPSMHAHSSNPIFLVKRQIMKSTV